MTTLATPLRPLACALAVLLSTAAAYGQSEWEYTPYRIQVWIAMESAPDLTDRLNREVAHTIMRRGEAVAGNIWDVSAAAAPSPLRTLIAQDVESLSVDAIAAADEKVLLADKLIVVGVASNRGGFRIEARELDCRARHWGPPLIKITQQRPRIAHESFLAMAEVFRPLARIEGTFEKTEGDAKAKFAAAQLRAGGLVLPRQSRWLPQTGDVLLPLIRRNDRTGKLRPGGIQIIPWTFLTLESRNGSDLECRIQSGLRSPIRQGSSRSTQQLALVVKPNAEVTRLIVQSNDTPPQLLAGYEIYSRPPGSAAPADSREPSELLGWTDWRGEIVVPRGHSDLRMLYVKNGGQVLARLPVVVGLEPSKTVSLVDDVQRLKAEGVVKGLQSEITDIAVRRQLIAANAKRYIDQGRFDDAQQMIDSLLAFRSVIELDDMLSRLQSENSSPQPRIQAKIEALFSGLRQQLNDHREHFDRALADDLASQLATARRSNP